MLIAAEDLKALELDLNSFDAELRTRTLNQLCELAAGGKIDLAPAVLDHNLHCHTFFSYNGYGFSPSYIVWLAKKSGHFAVGSVDFDVLDAVDEFHRAGELLGVRAVSGIETRVFVPEMADKEINSPGEPGVAYHMGVGFASSSVPEAAEPLLQRLRRMANSRTEDIVKLVNTCLTEIALDFEQDAAALTPAGNVTERHVCEAYRRKAEQVFAERAERVAYWAEKLSTPVEKLETIIDDPAAMEALIRSKTMKSGGVGYVKADPKSFPMIDDMNAFVSACGALPALAWLNGESAGESDPGALLDLHLGKGATVLNIVPDRNWNFSDPEVRAKKVNELNRIIAAAKERFMPIAIGTEMNAPGLKLVDTFDSEPLKPYVEDFVDGAAIVFAHTLLGGKGMGFLSDWAAENFPTPAEKYRFFADFGRKATAATAEKLKDISPISPLKLIDIV